MLKVKYRSRISGIAMRRALDYLRRFGHVILYLIGNGRCRYEIYTQRFKSLGLAWLVFANDRRAFFVIGWVSCISRDLLCSFPYLNAAENLLTMALIWAVFAIVIYARLDMKSNKK